MNFGQPLQLFSTLSALRPFRFALVGIAATFLYLVAGITAVSVGFSPLTATALAFLVSLLFSYFGHHRFSFSVRGRHTFFGPRYFLVSGVLTCATFALTAALEGTTALDHRLIVLAGAVLYAASSYGANAHWSFRTRRDAVPNRISGLF